MGTLLSHCFDNVVERLDFEISDKTDLICLCFRDDAADFRGVIASKQNRLIFTCELIICICSFVCNDGGP